MCTKLLIPSLVGPTFDGERSSAVFSGLESMAWIADMSDSEVVYVRRRIGKRVDLRLTALKGVCIFAVVDVS